MKRWILGFVVVLFGAAEYAWGDQITFTDTTPGAGNIIVPTGYEWINVTVQLWSGGGGGGLSGDQGYFSGNGGGGGAYGVATYPSLPAGSYAYNIGSGGSVASSGGYSAWNTPSNQSAYDIYLNGGSGGWVLAENGFPVSGGDGAGGTVLIGAGYNGGSGGAGGITTSNPGGGGGSAGPGGAGGNGSNSISNGWYPGEVPLWVEGTSFGPANGGAGGSFFNAAQGGGNGELIITYTAESVPGPSTPEPAAIVGFIGMGAMGLIAFAWQRRRRHT